jgi:hypothetical protein
MAECDCTEDEAALAIRYEEAKLFSLGLGNWWISFE